MSIAMLCVLLIWCNGRGVSMCGVNLCVTERQATLWLSVFVCVLYHSQFVYVYICMYLIADLANQNTDEDYSFSFARFLSQSEKVDEENKQFEAVNFVLPS
jgi:hypothetical protein